MIVKWTAPGGLHVALLRDSSVPLAAISLRLATGSRDDPPHRSGLAHVLEHLTYAGTHRFQRGEQLRLVQAWGGYVNARAATDWTTFEHVVSPDLAGAVLELETERFGDSPPRYDRREP